MLAFLNRLFGRSDIYFQGDLYMRRWRIGSKNWPGLRLHHIVRSDADRELHDHPFWFLSIMLWGSYTEYREGNGFDAEHVATTYRAPCILFRRATTLHRLELKASVWTLVLRGAYKREWGFMTLRGWVHWRNFTFNKGNTADETPPAQAYRAESSI